MGTGILMCGMNGAGKSTLGKALADKLNYRFIDNEDLYFPKTDPNYLYAVERTREEVERLLFEEIEKYKKFVFISVRGNYGDPEHPFFQYAVLVEVPRELRLQRVRDRSFKKLGDRMLPGGDLYEKEKQFYDFIACRPENTAEEWLKGISCPVIRVDGTKKIEENVDYIIKQLENLT